MKLMKISPENEKMAIAECASVIRTGGIAAFPTETFYALGVLFSDNAALEKLYAMKGRSRGKALSLIIGSKELLGLIAPRVNTITDKMMDFLWPGPLTFIVPGRSDLPDLITAGTGKVAVRLPGPSFALDLAREIGFPVTATSANISGMPAATGPDQVTKFFNDKLDLIIDGGITPGDKPSTIIEISNGKIEILREGVVSRDEILRAADKL